LDNQYNYYQWIQGGSAFTNSLRVCSNLIPSSINTYGLLTCIETVDTNKQNNLSKLADNKLKELNKIKEEISLSLIADYRVSKGKLIDFNNTDYGLNNTYLIKSASHNIDSKQEIVNVSIEKYKR